MRGSNWVYKKFKTLEPVKALQSDLPDGRLQPPFGSPKAHEIVRCYSCHSSMPHRHRQPFYFAAQLLPPSSVAALSSRLNSVRREQVVAALQAAAAEIESNLGAVLDWSTIGAT